MKSMARIGGFIAFTALYMAFLKFGVGMEHIQDSGWFLVFIGYCVGLGFIENLGS